MDLKRTSLYFAILLLLAGCATSINQKNANIHMEAAINASNNEDWDSSRRHWAKVVVNAKLADEPEHKMAVVNYEYGRALGVTCFFEDAEKHLNLAYQQDINTGGPYYKDLIELARLNLDQKKWKESIIYFEKAFPILDKINASTGAPHAYADILDDYASALENSNKKNSKKYRQEAKGIRDKNPKVFSITERTPYGKQCTNKSLNII